ncbi:hypothetical protein PPL_10835 [Heterostelium album PN500]|uniref:Ankyrin repeat protein n=1 Tax=Heterostelium pallidum (strain ATCC 26659 / Pp 5 / PN500) TaxID=670386 RepID=D3BS43_HETP5|nr:hypothetical protein PPL_10835 [Heterostelium album PN500]EFA75780.1 hypothetical protein PPL_10835 [Heterostelium album PN500]|eukprot:XP_020427914.1 hypothetical protein PPL_10835 [Heterostelium album PN500]
MDLLFKRILNSLELRRIIFKSVKDIHDQQTVNSLRCDCTISKFKQLYNESFETAITCGSTIELVEFLHDSFKGEIDYKKRLLYYHYQSNLPLIKFLHENVSGWFESLGTRVMDVAACSSLEVVEFLHFNRSEGCTTDALDNASKMGRFDIVQFLHSHRTEGCSVVALDSAPSFGSLELVMFLHYNRSEGCTTKAVDNAAENGYLEIVRFLIENRTEGFTNHAIYYSAIYGHLEILKYLMANIPETLEISLTSSLLGQCKQPVFQYLIENTSASQVISSSTMDCAACRGDLEFIKYLHFNRSEGCSSDCLHNAAVNGHLQVVKFLNENRTEGCKSNTMSLTASNGHFETFKYLMEFSRFNLRCSESVIDYFANYKDTTALQWLKDNTTLKCTVFAYRNAIESGNLATLQWVRENTTHPIPLFAMDCAASPNRNNLSILKYIHDNGGKCTKNAMNLASSLPIITFLHYNRSEGCSSKAMYRAICNDNVPIIKFLDQNTTDHLNTSYIELNDEKTFDFLARRELIKQLKI